MNSRDPLETLFLRNRYLLSLSILVSIAAGFFGISQLKRFEDPRITNLYPIIVTPYPGASAERVETLITENRVGLEDRVWRAFGMLERARLITSEETLDYLSAVRLGVNLGLVDRIPLSLVNELFILTQPAHLQKLEGCELETPQRDENRAEYVRQRLASLN